MTFKSKNSGADDIEVDYANEFDNVCMDYKNTTAHATQDRLMFENYGIRPENVLEYLVTQIHPLDWFRMEMKLRDRTSDFCTLTSEVETVK